MRNKLSGVAFILYGVLPLTAHEISTHRTITQAAVEYLLQLDPGFLQCAQNLESDLQIGTVDEDRSPRFMFHFLPRLDKRPFQATCDSIQWGLRRSDPPCSQTGVPPGDSLRQPLTSSEFNSHTWPAAVENAPISGIVDLGYVLHLLEDLGSPAHTRNDPHPLFDMFERSNANRTPVKPSSSNGLISLGSPDDYFRRLQSITQASFYSTGSLFDPALPGPSVAREDDDYFYDQRGRKIAHKGILYKSTRDRRNAEVDYTIAREQFDELGPIIIQNVASFLKYYLDVAQPTLRGCPTRQ